MVEEDKAEAARLVPVVKPRSRKKRVESRVLDIATEPEFQNDSEARRIGTSRHKSEVPSAARLNARSSPRSSGKLPPSALASPQKSHAEMTSPVASLKTPRGSMGMSWLLSTTRHRL
jgi:hypothetical protein